MLEKNTDHTPSDYSTADALNALGALSQESRLEAFRLLVNAGPVGVLAGDIAETLGVRQNTMSSNLAILLEAGLITRNREGRNIRYFADMEGMGALISFLMSDCCGGNPAQCSSAVQNLVCGCGCGS